MRVIKWLVLLLILIGVGFAFVLSWKQAQISTWNLTENEVIIHQGKFRPWPSGIRHISLIPYFPFLEKNGLRQEFMNVIANKKWEVTDDVSLLKSYIQYLSFKFSIALEKPELEGFHEAEIFIEEMKRNVPDKLLVKSLEDSLREKYAEYYYFKMVEALALKHFYNSLPQGGINVWLSNKEFHDKIMAYLMKKMQVMPVKVETPAVEETTETVAKETANEPVKEDGK